MGRAQRGAQNVVITAARGRDTRSVALVGSGGAGVLTAGKLLLAAAARAGRYGLATRTVGPQIRGGESAALLRIGDVPIQGLDDRFHYLIALDWRNADRFAAEIPLDADSVVIADPGAGEVPAALAASGARIVALPIAEIAVGRPQGRPNMVATGIAAAVLGLPLQALEAALAHHFGAATPALTAATAALLAGMEAAAGAQLARPASSEPACGRWLITGNHAAGLGALRGGVRFVAGYPITPATEILEWLAPNVARAGGTLVQAEDELAALNMAIGAAWGGVPALTATSGPGLALMVESIGLAVAAEVPVVVIDVMRGGPSTGIPTKAEQADLNLAVYGLHGDAPHVVVAPTSVADCLFTTQWAVHLAEAMQVPVLVLSDQFLGQASAIIDAPPSLAFVARRAVAERPAAGYNRYAVTADGVSPAALPGTPGGQHTAEGLEHTPRGAPSARVEDHLAQLDKRARKVEGFDYGVHWADIEGDGPVALLTWGSCTAAAREAISRLAAAGRQVRLIALRLLAPVRPEALAAALAGVERLLVVEQTHSGQLHRYLRAHYELPRATRALHRPGPLTLRPGEIVRAIEAWEDA